MEHKVRCGLVAAVLVLASLGASSAASAAVSLNGGPISLTARATSPVVLHESTNSAVTFNCAGWFLRGGTVFSDGTGTIPRGNVAFASCSIGGVGTFSFTQLADWSISTEFLLDGSGRIVGVATTLTLPPGSAQWSSGACSFQLAGTLVSLQSLTPTTPPALVSISSLPFASTALTLTAANASPSCPGIANGDRARINAGFALSTTLTGTLVP